ncbi:MAG: HypC/HybG/HupF family hydrogenase formation chaperone [Spirochaetales bacterium]|jgi:hydrogenase expression/formation protein HypC|nr:HypC/HybG/HupF family hydrogenase formation chaperone [Spirochaetales bacterium]
MCLAVPVKVLDLSVDGTARVEKDGVTLTVMSSLTPDVAPGDYVLLHAGFIIQKLDRDDAEGRIRMIKDLYDGED